MPNNYILLETIALTQSAASVTFDNLPTSGYTDLKVVTSLRGTSPFATMQLYMTFNGSTTGYSARQLYGDGTSATSATLSNSGAAISIINMNTTQSTANTFSSTEIYIPNYRSSNNKSVSADSVTENNATGALAGMTAGLWSNSAAITSITFTNQSADTFLANSTFSLYGVAALGTTPVLAPKATGGNRVENDGTYWIHTFLTSGVFTPQTNLTCDYLVVAGGGGGGRASGAGGGAGGYKTSIGGSAMSLSVQNYPVVVGAGGVAMTSGVNPDGSNGNNSSINSITSTGGGGGGGYNNGTAVTVAMYAGASGGSGGGGWGNPSTGTGGAASPAGQGNAGGAGNIGTGYGESSGGGGGAGGAGGNGQANNGICGNGGVGLSNSITGTAVFYAGGGGGGYGSYNYGTQSAGSGGNGGGGAGGTGVGSSGTGTINGANGTTNTGGGGGGGSYSGTLTTLGTAGTGGSGIVIIRYPIA